MQLIANHRTFVPLWFYIRSEYLYVLSHNKNIITHSHRSGIMVESPEYIAVNVWFTGPHNSIVVNKDIFHGTTADKLVGIITKIIRDCYAIYISARKFKKAMVINRNVMMNVYVSSFKIIINTIKFYDAAIGSVRSAIRTIIYNSIIRNFVVRLYDHNGHWPPAVR